MANDRDLRRRAIAQGGSERAPTLIGGPPAGMILAEGGVNAPRQPRTHHERTDPWRAQAPPRPPGGSHPRVTRRRDALGILVGLTNAALRLRRGGRAPLPDTVPELRRRKPPRLAADRLRSSDAGHR